MPEYLAPGVFVEEVSYRAKTIEGVSTTTTGFVGPTRYGPTDIEPEVITSLVEFERTYGDRQPLAYFDDSDPPVAQDDMHNYMWHAVRAFFENGGKRLYVQRVYRPLKLDDDGNALPGSTPFKNARGETLNLANDGRAFATVPLTPASPPDTALTVKARFPGVSGTRKVTISFQRGQNALTVLAGRTVVNGLRDNDIVWIADLASPPSPPGSPPSDLAALGDFYRTEAYEDLAGNRQWRFAPRFGGKVELADLSVQTDPAWSDQVRIVTATVTVAPPHPDGVEQVWSGLPLDPDHEVAGRKDSLFAKFSQHPDTLEEARNLPIVIERGAGVTTGLDVLTLLFKDSPPDEAVFERDESGTPLAFELLLTGGNDGCRPRAGEYEGVSDPDTNLKTGLYAFEDIDDISIVAAPGSTFGYENGYRADGATIIQKLIGHAERMRYRIAVLDAADRQSISSVRRMRASIDSKHAALYYPWVRVLDPVTQKEINLPPSGFVSGIYARNDVNRSVVKAPANEVVTLAIGFETMLNTAQQEVLNPEGINCFRFFEGRGNRLWGARTISSDPEWKYVNLRRYFAYLEHSIDRGTQWAVFEPNGPQLWANVRRTVSDFLFNEFVMGAFLGDKPETSYFVKCDRSTMTTNDLDNGRLVCLVGCAVVRPAEFVIFRVGQWTADTKK